MQQEVTQDACGVVAMNPVREMLCRPVSELSVPRAFDQARAPGSVDSTEANHDGRDSAGRRQALRGKQRFATKLGRMRRRVFVDVFATPLAIDRRARNHHQAPGSLSFISQPFEESSEAIKVGVAIGVLGTLIGAHGKNGVIHACRRGSEGFRFCDIALDPSHKVLELRHIAADPEDFVTVLMQHPSEFAPHVATSCDHCLRHLVSMPQMPYGGYTVATDGYARRMPQPRIGIPLTLDDRGRWREGRSYHYIDRNYADAIARAGGAALHLPIQAEPELLVASLDGLLLPGGDDFPAQSELPSDVSLDLVCPEQLAFDKALLEAAREHGIPILGICYGMQLMALTAGGVLDAHLPSERPDAACHRLPAQARHAISIEGTSLLASILGARSDRVNSLHQQAVRNPGPRYQAVATSPDGLIEALERPGHPAESWELGVQWHPEKMMDESGNLHDPSERLFRAFVEACRQAGGEP